MIYLVEINEDNILTITQMGNVPNLGVIPFQPNLDPANAQSIKKIAGKIAGFYINLGDHKNATKWIDVASEGASDESLYNLRWLRMVNLLAEGKRKEAYKILSQYANVEKPKLNSYYRATIASYYLKESVWKD